uniref:Peptidase A1 domain-containing protein n=1 Tax=Meloidogyne enterolobii TaxID=390850 RepID=A0A6V7TNC1_MELEN|nr:unnamed protein product [Meloidogyne enterolobii]
MKVNLNEQKLDIITKSSSSYSLNKTLTFSVDSINAIESNLYLDNIEIGGIKIKNITIASAIKGIPIEYIPTTGKDVYCPIDGEFGLAPLLNDKNKIPTTLNLLTKYLSKPIVTIYTINDLGADTDNQNIGTLTVGEENTENCIPPYKYVELAESNQWSVEINKIELSGNKQLKNTKSKMFRIVEDGFYMYMPKGDLDNLAGILNAEIPQEIGGFYKLNITECKKPKPTITFMLGGPKIGSKHSTNPKEIITTTITLAPYQYIAPTEYGNECLLLFVTNEEMDYDNKYINMGEVFLRNRCVSLNWVNGRMGFADGKKPTKIVKKGEELLN